MPKRNPNETVELMNKLRPNTFISFLKKHGITPPNMVGTEYDEDELMRAEIEGRRDPVAEEYDPEDDKTFFEISIVNRNNKALSIDCRVSNGEVIFNKVRLFKENGISGAKKTWLDKARCPIMSNKYPGPQFRFLSEPLQNELVSYLYTVGLRPEIGIAVEYLSWNKEQRLYMDWLKQMYFGLFAEEIQQEVISVNVTKEKKLKEAKQNDF